MCSAETRRTGCRRKLSHPKNKELFSAKQNLQRRVREWSRGRVFRSSGGNARKGKSAQVIQLFVDEEKSLFLCKLIQDILTKWKVYRLLSVRPSQIYLKKTIGLDYGYGREENKCTISSSISENNYETVKTVPLAVNVLNNILNSLLSIQI